LEHRPEGSGVAVRDDGDLDASGLRRAAAGKRRRRRPEQRRARRGEAAADEHLPATQPPRARLDVVTVDHALSFLSGGVHAASATSYTTPPRPSPCRSRIVRPSRIERAHASARTNAARPSSPVTAGGRSSRIAAANSSSSRRYASRNSSTKSTTHSNEE